MRPWSYLLPARRRVHATRLAEVAHCIVVPVPPTCQPSHQQGRRAAVTPPTSSDSTIRLRKARRDQAPRSRCAFTSPPTALLTVETRPSPYADFVGSSEGDCDEPGWSPGLSRLRVDSAQDQVTEVAMPSPATAVA